MKDIYFLVAFVLFNILAIYSVKFLKFFIFKHRKNIFFRLFYSRIKKIGIPLLLLIDGNFIIYFINNEKQKEFYFYFNILVLGWLFYEIIKYIIYVIIALKLSHKDKIRKEVFNLAIHFTKLFIVLIIFISILSHLGVNFTAIITSLGIGGAIIGLAAKSTLENFFDSIRIISEDAFHQGDWIETKDFEGMVADVGFTSTQVRTFDNALITVPNTLLANSWIKNYSRRVIGRRIKFHLKIKYTTNTPEINRVIQEIRKMLEKHPGIVTDKKIENRFKKTIFKNALFSIEDKYGIRKTLLVYLDEFDEYSMNILVYAYSISVDWEEWLRVKQDVYMKILKIIENSKLELAYPTEEIYINRGKELWKN
ncbi:mechanosensitive ion channel family protein [Lebetimonas natsushimae]|nr:mechanosensitive ion channel family protein [Lebetimonas natsushimae]